MSQPAEPPVVEPVAERRGSGRWATRITVGVALALLGICASSAGDLPSPQVIRSHALGGGPVQGPRAGSTIELEAEDAVSADMVRLVPAGFRRHGPDVAKYQHPKGKAIDWAAAKRSGAGYAFIKATEGTTVVNPWFRVDWAGAGKAGLPRGAYHFARPTLPLSTATTQAHAFLAVAGRLDRAGDMPAVLDLESTGGLRPGQLIAWAQEWVRTVQNATGRAPVLYTYQDFWRRAAANSSALNHLPLWIADYSEGRAGAGRPAGPTRPLVGHWPDWAIWQWTDRGRVPGVAAPVDVNVFNGGAARMRELADGTRRRSFPPLVPGRPTHVRATGGDHGLTVTWMPGFDGNSRPTAWRVSLQGTGRSVVVPGNMLSAHLRGLHNGRTFRLVVEQQNVAGWSSATRPVTASTARAATVTGLLLARRAVVAGDTVTAVAQVRADGAPLAGARVYFWIERGRKRARVATGITGVDGKVRAEIAVPASSRVQAGFAGKPRATASRSGHAGVIAVPRLAVDVPVSADNGRPMAVAGSAVGAPRGSAVVLQQWTKRGWVAVGRSHVRPGGRFVFVLKAAAGLRHYRVVVPATRVTGRVQSTPATTSIG